MSTKTIDFRSDTVTRPTDSMRAAMASAVVGDDVMNEDPTINELQGRIATMFGKEAALFFPTGTMTNLTAVMSWCPNRGSEVILGDKSHIFLFEQAGAAFLGGVAFHTVPNLPNGTMDFNEVTLAIRDDDIHEPVSQLIAIEQTHNACGGRVIQLEYLQKLRELSQKHNIPIHMDGARIWNACIALNCSPSDIAKHVDSLSVCLSKGIGAPAGSCLVGSTALIAKAKRLRKALGGGMRQVGVLAAAALVGLNDFEAGILKEDHKRTQKLAAALNECSIFKLDLSIIESNMVFVTVIKDNVAGDVCKALKERGVFASAWSPTLIRFVCHRDQTDADIDFAINVISEVCKCFEHKD
jgi:threonine aldolase